MRNWFEALRRNRAAPRPIRPLARYRYVRFRWRLLFAIVDWLGHRLIRTRLPDTEAARQSPRSILLVQLDHLGDAILSTGLLRGLKAAYPEAHIDILASSTNAEFFECLPEVRRVFVSRVTRFSGYGVLNWIVSTIRWGWHLRAHGYDLAIDPRGDFPSAIILRLCGAPVRLGWGCGGGGFLLTHQAEFVWGRHEVLSRQALLDQLNIAPPPGEPAWPPRFATKHSPRRGIAGQPSPMIVLHVGTGTHAKRWPAEHWQELIGRLILEHDPRLVLVGSAAEGETIDPLPGVRNCCGKLSIEQLAALLERADLLIGGDSGPAHLAAAVGTPTVVLFSGTNRAEQWQPWGPRVRVLKHSTSCSPCHRARCPLKDHPCLSLLQPLTVLAAAREFLPTPIEIGRPALQRTAA